MTQIQKKSPPRGAKVADTEPQSLEFLLFDSKTDTQPKRSKLNWSELTKLLRQRTITDNEGEAKTYGSAISGYFYESATHSTFAGSSISLVFLDFDGIYLEEIEKICKKYGCRAFIYSTHCHTYENPKYRAVIPLKNPVARYEWLNIWKQISLAFHNTPDPKVRSESHLHLLPSCPKSRERFADELEVEGVPLDIKTLPQLLPNSRFTNEHRAQELIDLIKGQVGGDYRALSALKKQIVLILNAKRGERIGTLRQSAFTLGYLDRCVIVHFDSHVGRQNQIERALFLAARSAGIPRDEARAAIQKGFTDGQRSGFEEFDSLGVVAQIIEEWQSEQDEVDELLRRHAKFELQAAQRIARWKRSQLVTSSDVVKVEKILAEHPKLKASVEVEETLRS